MAQADEIQETLEQKRLRLRQLEVEYIKAKEFLKGPEWFNLQVTALIEIQDIVAAYQGKDATEAAFKMGRIKQILFAVQKQTDIIQLYHTYEAEIKRYNARA